MGKKNKKRSNKKGGGGGTKPHQSTTTSPPRNAEALAAPIATDASGHSDEWINLVDDSPEKAVVVVVAAATELPVVAEQEELPAEIAGNNVPPIFDSSLSVLVVDSSTSDQTAPAPLVLVEDNDCALQPCESTAVSESKNDNDVAATANVDNGLAPEYSSTEETPTPIVPVDDETKIPNGDHENDKEEGVMQYQLSTVKETETAGDLVVKKAVDEDVEEEGTTTMVDQVEEVVTPAASLAATNDLVQDNTAVAAASRLPALKNVAVEETVLPTVGPAEETVVSSLVDSVHQETDSVSRTKAKPEASLARSHENVEKPELVGPEQAVKEDSVSCVKENSTDAVAVAIEEMEENIITTTNASSSSSISNIQAISCPTPINTKNNNNIDFESKIETPSKVSELKSKLWDSKGLQVRIRPSLTAADLQQRKHSSAPLAPVPSPYKPTSVPSTIPSFATENAAANGNKDTTSAHAVSQPSEVTAASASLSSNVAASPRSSSSATGLSANNNGRRLARRKGPTAPKSILDDKALLAALQERGVAIKDIHLSAFYQALHRQQYPDLPTFVENFYKHESNRQQQQHGELLPTLTGPSAQTSPVSLCKNKNRNKMQLPKAFLEFLSDPQNGFATMTSKIVEAQTSSDKSTTKLAIELHDGKMIESVLMRYNKNSQENHRASLCISSQCGCAMGCTFCATGMMGLSGNLTTAEILEQIIHADGILAREWSEQQENKQQHQQAQEQQQASDPRTKKQTQKKLALDAVRNVVFMGMGTMVFS
jgi:hypothetical protein